MRTAHLEKEYEKTISDSARLLDGERDRVRRMEHLFLKFENEALRLQLEESNGHLLGFSTADSEACAQLQDACKEIDRLESQAQTSSNEISRLKVCTCRTLISIQTQVLTSAERTRSPKEQLR